MGKKPLQKEKLLGEILETDRGTLAITGILEDFTGNSHIDFDMLVSMSTNQDALNPVWISMNYFTYLKLIPGTNPDD